MKKILLSAGLLLSAVLLVQAQQKKKDAKAARKSDAVVMPEIPFRDLGGGLPPLRVVDTGGKSYTAADLRKGNHLFLVMFNPTCGHCQQMAKLMGQHAELFSKSDVLFMAGPAVMDYMNSFYQASSIGLHPEMRVGVDSASAVDQLYNYKMLPQINVYNKERKLVKVFYGDVPLDSLKMFLP